MAMVYLNGTLRLDLTVSFAPPLQKLLPKSLLRIREGDLGGDGLWVWWFLVLQQLLNDLYL
jgi:hypothetical protein